MTASDGRVLRTKKIVDHGPDFVRWNLVIVGDGYRETELTEDYYYKHVDDFVATLRTTPPFDELYCAINIHRIDVASTESGADDPNVTPELRVNTYFDAHYALSPEVPPGSPPIYQLLYVDIPGAYSVATAEVPTTNEVLCIVNAPHYGGSGSINEETPVAACSIHPASALIAIHEMGHSAFGLADEYSIGLEIPQTEEPGEPNVTIDTNRDTNKWNALIDPNTPMPTLRNAGCGPPTDVDLATLTPSSPVGTFEGANYRTCDVYRPVLLCRMKANSSPFCPVCSGVIRATLQTYLPPELIDLRTPNIAFAPVPAGRGGIGVTTHAAIVWEVETCRRRTFEIIEGPTGGFGTPFGASVSVTPDPTILETITAQLWLSYTSTNPGDQANGTVTIRCAETGESWTIDISAETIPPPRSAIVLVLDRSASMNDDAGDGVRKVTKVREAFDAFINLMFPEDGIGLVRFNQTAQQLMEVQAIGANPDGEGRTTALAHISGSDIDPQGATSIGDGVVNGKLMLDQVQSAAVSPYDVTAMIVLTDGRWNRPPDLASVSGSITAHTFAIGFGLPSNISVGALTTLCQGHNGYLLITGTITPDQSQRLEKYFLQILADVTNAQITVDPRGVLNSTAEHRIPFWICGADYGMDLILLSHYSDAIDFELEAPDGTRITPKADGARSQFVSGKHIAYYRCALPVLPANADGSHEGKWNAVLKLASSSKPDSGSKPRTGLSYEFVAHTYSSLTFSADVTQNSFEVGAKVHLSASLREHGAPLVGRARVWAEITRPDKLTELLALDTTVAGQFLAAYFISLSGVFTIRLRARGETLQGTPFERERTLTAVGAPGADKWSPNDPKAGWGLAGRPYKPGLALLLAVAIWISGFIWGSIVFITPALKGAAEPMPYISAHPVISFPLLILWLFLTYFLARMYLKNATDKAREGLRFGLLFLLVNLILDLMVIVILLGTGIGFFVSLTVWLAYFILLMVPWLTGRSLQAGLDG